MALFTITLEPFLQKIKKTIEGIDCNGTNYKTLAYADDTVIFLHDEIDKQRLEHILKVYEKASGAKINNDKSQELKLAHVTSVVKEKPIEILGIKFTTNSINRTNINWKENIEKIKNTLTKFKQRDITILGKATIINTYVISQIIHLSRIIPPLKKHIKEINSSISNFLGMDKPKNYTYANMHRHPTKGGFGLPHVETKVNATVAMWMQYYSNKTEQNLWTDNFKELLKTKPQPNQNIIHHNLLAIKNKDRFNWNKVTMKQVYEELLKPITKPFQIENVLQRTMDWDKTWTDWTQYNVNNKLKIEAHKILGDNAPKITNRSGNCCTCDLPHILSRDHSYLTCTGLTRLQKYIHDTYDIEIDNRIFFNKYNSIEDVKLTYTYIYTVTTLAQTQKGKWGKINETALINTFQHYIYRTSEIHESQY